MALFYKYGFNLRSTPFWEGFIIQLVTGIQMKAVWVMSDSVNIPWAFWCQRFKHGANSWTVIDSYLGHVWGCLRYKTYCLFLCKFICSVRFFYKHQKISRVLNDFLLHLWMFIKVSFMFDGLLYKFINTFYYIPLTLKLFPQFE